MKENKFRSVVFKQGIRIKWKVNGAGLEWKNKPVALLCRRVRYYTRALLVQTHNTTTVKEIAE